MSESGGDRPRFEAWISASAQHPNTARAPETPALQRSGTPALPRRSMPGSRGPAQLGSRRGDHVRALTVLQGQVRALDSASDCGRIGRQTSRSDSDHQNSVLPQQAVPRHGRLPVGIAGMVSPRMQLDRKAHVVQPGVRGRQALAVGRGQPGICPRSRQDSTLAQELQKIRLRHGPRTHFRGVDRPAYLCAATARAALELVAKPFDRDDPALHSLDHQSRGFSCGNHLASRVHDSPGSRTDPEWTSFRNQEIRRTGPSHLHRPATASTQPSRHHEPDDRQASGGIDSVPSGSRP